MARVSKLIQIHVHTLHWCRRVLRDFERGKIPKEVAINRLRAIEESAYDSVKAEPDGDITYYVASTRDKIEQLAAGK